MATPSTRVSGDGLTPLQTGCENGPACQQIFVVSPPKLERAIFEARRSKPEREENPRAKTISAKNLPTSEREANLRRTPPPNSQTRVRSTSPLRTVPYPLWSTSPPRNAPTRLSGTLIVTDCHMSMCGVAVARLVMSVNRLSWRVYQSDAVPSGSGQSRSGGVWGLGVWVSGTRRKKHPGAQKKGAGTLQKEKMTFLVGTRGGGYGRQALTCRAGMLPRGLLRAARLFLILTTEISFSSTRCAKKRDEVNPINSTRQHGCSRACFSSEAQPSCRRH